MNIFVTSPDPYKCATYLDSVRVNKMIVESSQMLSTALRHYGGEAPMKSFNENHTVNKWVRKTRNNYLWLCQHLFYLCEEYRERRLKTHKCAQYIDFFINNQHAIPDGPLTDFVKYTKNQQLGLDFTAIPDVYTSYKKYLQAKWELDKL